MASSTVKFTSQDDVNRHLNIELTPVAGQTLQSIVSNSLASDIVVTGMTPSDVCDMYGGTQFDFGLLKSEFKQICPDFDTILTWNTKSIALQFSTEMLFKVGPESRRVKKSEGNKSWKFRFFTKEGNTIIGHVIVSTYTSNAAPNKQPVVRNRLLALTIKQASLLATHTLCNMVSCMIEKNKILLTPLARAIFCKDDITKIMIDLNIEDNPANKSSLICTIISSCQSDGQYLMHSKCHFAVCAALCATKNMKDRRVALDIVRKILKQYIAHGKNFNIVKFRQICKFATGGIPAEFEPSKLFAEMEEIQKLTRNNLRDVESTMDVRIQRPLTISGTSAGSDNSIYGAP